jgi:hypothetical protein
MFGTAPLHQFGGGAAQAVPNTQNPQPWRSEAEGMPSSFSRSEPGGASPTPLCFPDNPNRHLTKVEAYLHVHATGLTPKVSLSPNRYSSFSKFVLSSVALSMRPCEHTAGASPARLLCDRADPAIPPSVQRHTLFSALPFPIQLSHATLASPSAPNSVLRLQ